MADDPCCFKFGGFISLEAGDQKFAIRGEIEIEPTRRSKKIEAHHDGSTYGITTVKPVRAKFKFSHPCEVDFEALLKACATNLSIIEEDNGRNHLFTDTSWEGEPNFNVSTGEIDGMSIAGGTYQKY